MKRALPACILVMAVSCGSQASRTPSPEGHWEGSLLVGGSELGIALDFAADGDSLRGTIDIPVQGAAGLALSDLRQSGDSLSFDLQAGPGVASFRGVLTDSVLSGTFDQAGYAGIFSVSRSEVAYQMDRPYIMQQVMLEGDGFQLSGTISMPPSPGPHPGVALLTGSGSQDRNENVFGFLVFDCIADRLTRDGFVVLRCDDRGVGGSTGASSGITDSTLAGDALLMIGELRRTEGVDPSKIGLLGHSEGSNVAFQAAVRDSGDVAFVVSMAGPASRGYEILLSQVESLAQAAGRSEEETRALLDMQRQVMDMVIAGVDPEDLRPIVEQQVRAEIAALPEIQQQAMGNIDSLVSANCDQAIAVLVSPWFRRFLERDPLDDLRQLSCPVLALYGQLDIQVQADPNASLMQQALSGDPSSKVIVFPGANHLFQSARTGAVEEYAMLPKEFTPGFLDSLSAWMLGVTMSAGE